jgi:hypothetical protein
MPRPTLAIASAQNSTTEDLFIEISRSIDVGDGDKKCDREPVAGRHLIALPFDLHAVHLTAPYRRGEDPVSRDVLIHQTHDQGIEAVGAGAGCDD